MRAGRERALRGQQLDVRRHFPSLEELEQRRCEPVSIRHPLQNARCSGGDCGLVSVGEPADRGKARAAGPGQLWHGLASTCRPPPAPAAALPPTTSASACTPAGALTRLGRGGKHRAEQQIVQAAVRGDARRPRPPCTDRPIRNPIGASVLARERRHRVAAQVHAVGAGRQRHVESIVDEHSRAGAPDGRRRIASRGATDLAPPCRARGPARDPRRPRPPPRRAATSASSRPLNRRRSVIMHTTGRTRPSLFRSGARLIETMGSGTWRVVRNDQISTRPASRFTRPRPDTAPRTKSLVSNGSITGRACTK